MQDSFLWGFIAVAILILLIVVIVVRKKYPRPTDYYSFFLIGVMWTVIGISMTIFNDGDYFFLVMGIVFMIVGFVNKGKWKKNKVKWKNLKKPERIFQAVIIAVLALLIAAVFAFLIMKLKSLI